MREEMPERPANVSEVTHGKRLTRVQQVSEIDPAWKRSPRIHRFARAAWGDAIAASTPTLETT